MRYLELRFVETFMAVAELELTISDFKGLSVRYVLKLVLALEVVLVLVLELRLLGAHSARKK